MTIFEDQNMNFYLEEFEECKMPKYRIVIKSNDENKTLINKIELIDEKELSHIILIINQIYHNCNIPKDDMNSFKKRVGSVLTDKYLKDKTIDLNALDDIRRNRFSFKNIKNCFNIFKFIYDKKKEIPSEKINYLLCEIEYTLNQTRILDEVSIKYLKNFLEEIYKKENNETTEGIINNEQNLNGNDFQTNNTTQNANNTNPSNNPKKDPEKENGSGEIEEKKGSKDNESDTIDFKEDPLLSLKTFKSQHKSQSCILKKNNLLLSNSSNK
jgi:hypothetical protein